MRIGAMLFIGALMLPAAALAQAKPFTPPQMRIVSDGSVDYKVAQRKFDEAYRACVIDPVATKSDAAFLACLNRHLPKGIRVEK